MDICELTRSLGLNKKRPFKQKVYEVNIKNYTNPSIIVKISKFCVCDNGYKPHYYSSRDGYYYFYLNRDGNILSSESVDDGKSMEQFYFDSIEHATEIIKKKGLLQYLK